VASADADGDLLLSPVTGGIDDDDDDDVAAAATFDGEHWLDGGVSLRGGIRSLIASRPLASANEVILWLGENPCNATRDALPSIIIVII